MQNQFQLDYSRAGPFYIYIERIGVASATPVSPFGLTQTNIFLQQYAEAQAASQQALHELRQFMDTLAKANMPGFNPGSCNEPDVKSTFTVTVTSHHTTRLGMYSYPEPGVLFKQNTSPERIHTRINSGGQSPCRDDPHENVRDTDRDQWADIAQTGLRPSCHPCSSDGEISLPDVSLTLPVSSSAPPTPVPPPCINPHPKLIQEERFTPRKAMPSKLTVVHSTTVNSCLAQPGPRKETGWTKSLSSDSVNEISKKLEIHNSLTREFLLISMDTPLIDSWTVGKTHCPEIVGGKSIVNYDGFLKLTEQA
ncbi:hypothetical protein BT96DRAFT_1005159 [Gymnopus androsaceus JB14]|uniref:Uncharacterized protein n=1 Tax=Gymnopus androsaceus JB14 TaxID=1447944 RepID=A0A6A4GPN3_9AGAR|nr:hypothetical protein BT96DRAFT_1005159 [Gymnopus androsaceus JB14]